jgi:D-beta-D-heptose 7-phosphate kinase/D-beta-D-heptose 1-phosphate adenosyltransferase
LESLNSNILITRGEKGMSLFEKNGKVTHIPTFAKEVYDIIGAGDTSVAALALALASDSTYEEAAIIANHAAGITVGKIGTSTVTIDELKKSVENE